MDAIEIRLEDTEWFQLVYGKVQWQDLVNTVVEF
jgi:hypothetical protein